MTKHLKKKLATYLFVQVKSILLEQIKNNNNNTTESLGSLVM